jgi:hypothetical protein
MENEKVVFVDKILDYLLIGIVVFILGFATGYKIRDNADKDIKKEKEIKDAQFMQLHWINTKIVNDLERGEVKDICRLLKLRENYAQRIIREGYYK